MSGASELSSEPETLLDLAQSDPRRALELGHSLVDRIPVEDHVAKSKVFRAMGVAARLAADMTASLSYGQRSLEEASMARDRALRSNALMSLGGSLAFAGDNAGAFRALDEANRFADSLQRAEIEFQRGTILGRLGAMNEALACFALALPVFAEDGDRESMAMTLHNRAMVQISAGNLDDAEIDLLRARTIDAEDRREIGVAGIEHGLGLVASLRGDIPQALAHFDISARRFTELVGSASEIQVSRCEALLYAGLFRESLELANEIAADLHQSGLAEDEAEAKLVGAQSALLAGRADVALSLANQADEMFSTQGRSVWAAMARLVGIQTQQEAGVRDPRLVAEAREVADVLETERHVSGAHRARLLAGMIGASLGWRNQALADLRLVADRVGGPIESQLQSRLARATMRVLEGDHRGAIAAARAGMQLLHDYQAVLGATDVRVGVERHGRDLGNLGLSLALETRNARRVFRWMELGRGSALSHRPVTPPDDDDLAGDLAALRQVTAELRSAEGDDLVGLRRRQRRLQDSVRDRVRVTRGKGRATDQIDLAILADALGDRTLVELAGLDGVIWAVVVGSGRFRLRELGREADVIAELTSLRFIMRRLARGRGSAAVAEQVAKHLDNLLFGNLRIGEGPLVIVPTPSLHATPWWALPTCQTRPLTVSPSAELWYRATQAEPELDHVLVVAGPDLELSDAEVIEVGDLHPGAILFSSEASSVESVHSSLDGAGTAHIACHAFFQFENPMFSSLHLADGDLNVYDIERLTTAPAVVVLSACDSGFTDTHPGEELMGLSSALLSMGTRSIVASVGLVPDSAATKDLMVALHRGLVAGQSASDALHAAQSELGGTSDGYIAASSFICIGSG